VEGSRSTLEYSRGSKNILEGQTRHGTHGPTQLANQGREESTWWSPPLSQFGEGGVLPKLWCPTLVGLGKGSTDPLYKGVGAVAKGTPSPSCNPPRLSPPP
jgi:hypothetical protein